MEEPFTLELPPIQIQATTEMAVEFPVNYSFQGIRVRARVPTQSYTERHYLLSLHILKLIRKTGFTIPFPKADAHRG